jgi:hypothetical protein
LPTYRYQRDEFVVTGSIEIPGGDMVMAGIGEPAPDLMVCGDRRVAIEVKTNRPADIGQLEDYRDVDRHRRLPRSHRG